MAAWVLADRGTQTSPRAGPAMARVAPCDVEAWLGWRRETEVAPRRRRVRRQVKWGLYAVGLFLILEYLVLPQLAGARKSVNLLGRINFAYVVAGVILEAASLVAYSQLTHTVLHHEGPPRSRLLRINMSSLAVSHIMPGGTAPGTAVAFRLLTQSGVSGADAGFALGMQGVGSALVLNSILWLALLVSVFMHGYNPLYAVAAGAGVVLMGLVAGLVLALTRGRNRSIEIIRRWAAHVPFLDGDKLAVQAHRVAERLGQFLAEPQVCSWAPSAGRRPSGCSTRPRCSCSSPRWARSSRPSTCWSPTAWPRCSPSSPSRPRASG